MATSIYFNGRVTSVPGSYSEVDASGLAAVGLSAVGIVAVLGEAEGGAPYTEGATAGIHRIANPSKVARMFRAGDLLEAGQILFDPSNDPAINGAAAVYFVKVNPATQSTYTFDNGAGDALTLTSVGWGLYTTQVNVEIADGTTQGKAITVVLEDAEESFDNVGGDDIFTLAYAPSTNGATTMTAAVNPATGVRAQFTKASAGLASDYDGRISGFIGLIADQDAVIVAGNPVGVLSSSAADTTQSVTVYGIVNGTGLPGSETLALNGTTPVVGATVWARVHGAVLSAATAGNVTIRDNTAVVTLSVITAGGPAVGGGVEVFSSALEVAGSTLSVSLDAAGSQKLLLIGTNTSDVATLEEITLNGTTAVISSTSWNSIVAVACSYVATARTITVAGLVCNSGDVVSVVSSNAGDTTQTATVYGLTVAGAVQTETLALNGTTPVPGTATWSKILGVALSAVALGTITVSAATEAVAAYVFDGSASRYAGFLPVDRVAVDGSTVSVVASGATTRTALVVGLNTAGAAQVEKFVLTGSTPVAGASTWREITGVCLGHVETTRTVTVSGDSIDLAVGTYTTVQQVLDYANARTGWTAVAVTTDPTGFAIADMDATTATSVLSATVGFEANLWAIVEAINAGSVLVTAAAAAGATGAPSNTASATYLTGGIEGATAFSDWQAALDLLRDERVNTVVVLTSDAAVHAAVKAHCVYTAGAGRSERDCVLGAASGTTLTAARAGTLALGTRHARYCIQDVERINTDGVVEQLPPYFTACVAAGMHSGAPVGTSLTFKYANVLDVIGDDATYTVRDDAETLIGAGVLVLERVPNKGWRWLRNITTYQIDDNLAYCEASVNAAVNFAVYEFRTRLEAIVGQPGFAGTVNATLGIAVALLGQLIEERVITSWRDITIELTDDVMTVDVALAPIIPVNFVKSTVHLVSSSISAAA